MHANDALTPGAAAALRRLVDANDPAGAVRLADDLVGDGEYGGARAVLREAAARWPTEAGVLLRRLELDVQYKRWDDFDELLRVALEHHPNEPALRMLEARRWEAEREFERAVAAYRHASRLRPRDPEPVVRGARALRLLGRSADARTWAREALAIREDAALHAAVGYASIDLDEPNVAVDSFRRAHRLRPDWGPWLDDFAGALMLAERWDEAVRAAIRSLNKSGRRNERAWTVFAIGHTHLGNDDRAERGYRNALTCARRDPSRAQGDLGLWLAKRRGGEAEAARLLAAACEAHPEWTEVRAALDRLGRPAG